MASAVPPEVILVYMTVPSTDEAEQIARALVEERLAACCNILPGITSLYRWEGRLETSAELVVIAKTRASLFEDLRARVVALHSYSVPAILALPILDGAPAYLNWLVAETQPDAAPA